MLLSILAWFKTKTVQKISIILLIIISFLYFRQCSAARSLEAKLKISENNVRAIHDTIRETTAKDGSLEYDKLSFLAKEIGDLKQSNADLYAEIKKTKGDVIAIIKNSSIIKSDTSSLIATVTPDTLGKIKTLDLSLDTSYSPGNYHSLKITANFDSLSVNAKLLKDEIGFTATTGIKKNGDNYEIFVRPEYPGMTITKLDGAYIDKNLFKRANTGRVLSIGIGIGYVPILYDYRTGVTKLGGTNIGMTLGVNVNLLQLLRKKR